MKEPLADADKLRTLENEVCQEKGILPTICAVCSPKSKNIANFQLGEAYPKIYCES